MGGNYRLNVFFTLEALIYFKGVIDELKNKGCAAVVLGCTEIPLAISESKEFISAYT